MIAISIAGGVSGAGDGGVLVGLGGPAVGEAGPGGLGGGPGGSPEHPTAAGAIAIAAQRPRARPL
jgi:hypothetical protein